MKEMASQKKQNDEDRLWKRLFREHLSRIKTAYSEDERGFAGEEEMAERIHPHHSAEHRTGKDGIDFYLERSKGRGLRKRVNRTFGSAKLWRTGPLEYFQNISKKHKNLCVLRVIHMENRAGRLGGSLYPKNKGQAAISLHCGSKPKLGTGLCWSKLHQNVQVIRGS